jgi:DNA-binding GntR family transcriptional regulator
MQLGSAQAPHVQAREARLHEAPLREDRIVQAYEKLRDLIVWGRLAPGTRIIESDVAGRLGISRTPVRSALQRLQQEGYILALDSGKQARLTVAPLTIDDARELFSIVGQVEGLAARRAAELDARTRTSLVRTLRKFNADLLHAAEAEHPDSSLIFDLDVDFHRSYVEAGSGPRLLALHNAIKPQAERYNRLYTTVLVGEIHTSVDEHESIIQSIAEGRPNEADQAAEINFRNAAERLSKVIGNVGERGSW